MKILKFGNGNIPINMVSSTWMEINTDRDKERYKVCLETCGGRVFGKTYGKGELEEAEKMQDIILELIKGI